MRRLAVLSLCILTLNLHGALADDHQSPLALTAVSDGDKVALTWLPVASAPVEAVRYNVYGFDGENRRHHLAQTPWNQTYYVADPGWANYSVAAVVGGEESEETLAAVCVEVDPNRWLPVGVGDRCYA